MSQYPSITHWHYLHGQPQNSARLKAQASDFRVAETLPFELSGSGEHLYLHIEKTGLNTGYLAQQIALFYGVKERDVSYAGRKDKHAVTRQWFSVWLPGKSDAPLPTFEYENCQLLETQWHNKKLRTGAVQSNQFVITLQDLSSDEELANRIELVKQFGVPNYFGPQRFGNINANGVPGNLVLANYLLAGESIRKREKRSMAISALRSWLFNECVSARLQKWQTEPKAGDAMSLAGSNSFFVVDDIDAEILQRLAEKDIAITAPMWGKGQLSTEQSVAEFEGDLAMLNSTLCDTLEGLDLRQERRKILLYPQGLTWQLEQQTLTLQFSLPSGCFATSVIRELLHITDESKASMS